MSAATVQKVQAARGKGRENFIDFRNRLVGFPMVFGRRGGRERWWVRWFSSLLEGSGGFGGGQVMRQRKIKFAIGGYPIVRFNAGNTMVADQATSYYEYACGV